MSRPAQLETITTQLKSAKGVAEKFKAQGQPARVRQMNHLHTSGKEIVLHELLHQIAPAAAPDFHTGAIFSLFPSLLSRRLLCTFRLALCVKLNGYLHSRNCDMVDSLQRFADQLQ